MKKIRIIFVYCIIILGGLLLVSQETDTRTIQDNIVGVEKVGKIIPVGEEIFLQNEDPKNLISNGFFITPNRILTTAHSVGSLDDTYRIYTQNKGIFLAQLLKTDITNDQAVLQIGKPYTSFHPFVFQKNYAIGDSIFTYVYNIETKKIEKKSGKIIAIIHNKIFSDIEFQKGNSGAPLFSEKQEIIGINSQQDLSTNLGISIGF